MCFSVLVSHAVGNEKSCADSDDADDKDQAPAPSTSTGKGGSPEPLEDEEDEEELPVFLWKPPQTTAAMGEWEAHTRVRIYKARTNNNKKEQKMTTVEST